MCAILGSWRWVRKRPEESTTIHWRSQAKPDQAQVGHVSSDTSVGIAKQRPHVLVPRVDHSTPESRSDLDLILTLQHFHLCSGSVPLAFSIFTFNNRPLVHILKCES